MDQQKPKILIVDDRPENLYALQKLLNKLEVTIYPALSGAEALELTLEHQFGVAIVDVQMPEMNGYELVSLWRGNRSTASLPVIFVSAIYSDEYNHRKGYDAGAVDFLSKPFVPEILLSKVRVFLELHTQRRELETVYAQVVRFNEELETQVRERTAELQRAYDMLAHLDQNKADFISVIAHELRTPLSLIRGYAEMLGEEPPPQTNEMYQLQVGGIVNGAKRMHEVVNTMLDVIRIDSQLLQVIPEPCSLAEIVSSLQQQLAEALQQRQITLHLDGLEALPAIHADPDLLPKVFANLLVNAIKYTPDGGKIVVSSEIREEKGQEVVDVIVKDTGIGIDPEFQELIFTKFYQTGSVTLHSSGKTKFKGGGPGLGLAIAKGIVDAHGGRIWVESSGHDEECLPGSAFHVVLPSGK